MARWDFDIGKNMDAETGMAEFSRATLPVFPGLKSSGTQPLQLKADPKVAPDRLFAPSPRGMAMRSGVEAATGKAFAASGKLQQCLSRREGAVALWLRPEDWEGNQKGPFRIFLAADDGGRPRTNELLLYKNGSNNNLIFLIGDNAPGKWCSVLHSIWDWKRGEWHFVCASWTPDTLVLFVDGKATQAPRPRLPAHDYQVVHLGSRGWKNEGGLTLLDDVAIFPRALTKEEMETYFVQTRPVSDGRTAPFTHRLGLQTPMLDGEIGRFEYGMLSNATFDIHSGEISNASRWAAARDATHLFFACETAAPSRPASISRRDGNVWEDESIELHLEYGRRHWQFILNANQVVYDATDNAAGWNMNGFRQAQRLHNGRWTVEMALPLAELGIAPFDGDGVYFTLCRSTGQSTGHTAASPLLRKFADRENFIKLVFDRQATPVEVSFQALPGSEGKLDMTAALPRGHRASLHLLGSDAKGRKLYEKTLDTATHPVWEAAGLHATGLAKEGALAYSVLENGSPLVQASLKYISPEKVKVRHLLVHSKEQQLEAALAFTPPLPPGLVFAQTLKDKRGNIVMRHLSPLDAQKANQFQGSLTWDLAGLPPGDYDYYLSTLEGGQEKPLHHQYFLKPAPQMPWDVFQGGLETQAPAPWRAPQCRGAVLECLTQRYDFGDRLLPRQIHAQGVPLLESPVSLRINGTVLDVQGRLEILRQDALETHFRTRAEAAGLTLEVQGVLEYDGWLRLALSFRGKTPGTPVALNDLALVIPMARDASKLVCLFRPADTGIPSGKLDRTCHYDLMDHPVFWIGDADQGLFWGADSLRGTHLKKTDDILTVLPATSTHGARAIVKLVDSPLALTQARTVEFGLQATPVKPLKRLPRPYMLRGGNTYSLGDFFRIFNYYNPAYSDRPQARRQREAADRRGNAIYAFYACIYGVSPFCPEWPWHCEQWISSPPGPGSFKQDFPANDEKARDLGLWTFACVANPQFLNWQLYWLGDFIHDREVGVRDLYFDMAYPRPCDNLHHGCGWRDDFGVLRKTYPINANRTFTKRIRKMLRDKDPASVLMYHPSGEPLPPIYGLVDFTIDGEIHVLDVARAENYFDIFTPELMQSCYIGAKSGTNAAYISQLNRAAQLFNPARSEYWRRKVKAPAALRAVRHFLGYCLLHDIRPQAGACIYNEGEALEKQLYGLGYGRGDFAFHPYWRKGCPVASTAPVLLSAYAFPNGKTLAVAVNDSKNEAVQVTITLVNQAGLRRVYDLENGQDLASPVSIPPKGFRLVVFDCGAK